MRISGLMARAGPMTRFSETSFIRSRRNASQERSPFARRQSSQVQLVKKKSSMMNSSNSLAMYSTVSFR